LVYILTLFTCCGAVLFSLVVFFAVIYVVFCFLWRLFLLFACCFLIGALYYTISCCFFVFSLCSVGDPMISLTPILECRQHCSSVYSNVFVYRQQKRRRKYKPELPRLFPFSAPLLNPDFPKAPYAKNFLKGQVKINKTHFK
jgi:hypothetical protein